MTTKTSAIIHETYADNCVKRTDGEENIKAGNYLCLMFLITKLLDMLHFKQNFFMGEPGSVFNICFVLIQFHLVKFTNTLFHNQMVSKNAKFNFQ